MTLQQIIQDMIDQRYRLLQASKTSTGKPAYNSYAMANRSMAETLAGWIYALEALDKSSNS